MPKSISRNNNRVTIKHVAQAAGVSTMTVSRVVNEHPDVSPETRQQILDIIAELGYQPNTVARSLIRRRSMTLGVVTAGLRYMGPSRTLNGITTQADALGYNLLLSEMPGFNTDRARPILDKFLASQVDGIVWAVPEIGDNRDWILEQLPSLPAPVVFLTMAPRPDLAVIATDNALGGRLAAQRLVARGCQNIGHIAGPQDWWEARERLAGWREALSAAGQAVEERAWVEGNWSSASGEAAIEKLHAQYPEMDAVFVANDQMALAVLQWAARKGLRVPQDLAVVGFDGLAESAYFWPALTTVSQDQQAAGCQAIEMLVRMIESGAHETSPVWLEPVLIVRESA